MMINVNTLYALFGSNVARLWWWQRGVGPSLAFALQRPEYWLTTFVSDHDKTCINRWHPRWSRILIGHSQYVHQGYCDSFYNALEVSQSSSCFRGRARNYVIEQLNQKVIPGGLMYQYLKEVDDLEVFHYAVDDGAIFDVIGMERWVRDNTLDIAAAEHVNKDPSLRETIANLLGSLMKDVDRQSKKVLWEWIARYETWLPLLWYKNLDLSEKERYILLELGPLGFYTWKYCQERTDEEILLLID